MRASFNKLKPSVREPLVVYGTAIIITLFSIIYYSIFGYPLVNTATETLGIIAPPLYMIPIFVPYGILIGELILIWIKKTEKTIFILFLLECVILSVFAFLRFFINIPFSGHAIILFFYLPHQIFNERIRYPLRFVIGIAVLIITIIYKLVLWNDPITFILGTILGIVIWLPGFLLRLKIKK